MADLVVAEGAKKANGLFSAGESAAVATASKW
jgi:hypothetical protein